MKPEIAAREVMKMMDGELIINPDNGSLVLYTVLSTINNRFEH